MNDIKTDFPMLKKVMQSNWIELSEKKLFFGHQSVGFNIVDGLNDIVQQLPKISLNIKKTNDPDELNKPLFAHSSVGQNKDPISKCDDFKRIIENGIGDRVDIAFFKFCYVDITTETDLNNIFEVYKDTMDYLGKKYSNIVFIHITVPLRVYQTGPKAWIKKIIGRQIGGYSNNIKRNQFNEMLRKEYEGKVPFFDLAKIESTFPDGKRMIIEKKGEMFYSLVRDYTDDGGHLNKTGRIKVAEQLLILLANLTNDSG